jgi:hypothetical protein
LAIRNSLEIIQQEAKCTSRAAVLVIASKATKKEITKRNQQQFYPHHLLFASIHFPPSIHRSFYLHTTTNLPTGIILFTGYDRPSVIPIYSGRSIADTD